MVSRAKRRKSKRKKFFENLFELADLAELLYYVFRGIGWLITKLLK